MAVTNFYEKYGISQTDNLQKIQYIIKEKIQNEENDTFSPGHRERMEELQEAQKAFANEQSRNNYDKSLNTTQEKTVSNADSRNVIYEKWLPTVYKFYNIGHYDAAKTAYENAVSGGNPDLENSDVFEFAARICEGTGEYEESLKYINKAVVGQSNDAKYLITKSDILSVYETKAYPKERVDTLIEMEKRTLELAVQIAQQNRDVFSLGNAYNNLAFVWYRRNGGDRDKAKEYAEKALGISQAWLDAKNVLQEVYDKHNLNLKSDIETEKIKRNEIDGCIKELQNIDSQIAGLQAKINKSKNAKTAFGVGIGVAVLGFIFLFVAAVLGIILLIGGIIAAFIGHNMKVYVNANDMNNLQSQRTQRYNDYMQKNQAYETFKYNLHMQYKNFCANFKDASDKYGIEYKNIDQAFLMS